MEALCRYHDAVYTYQAHSQCESWACLAPFCGRYALLIPNNKFVTSEKRRVKKFITCLLLKYPRRGCAGVRPGAKLRCLQSP